MGPLELAAHRLVVVSPHADDAVLSCGALRSRRQVLALNLFDAYAADAASRSEGQVSEVARYLFSAWGVLDAAGARAVRDAEDAAACGVIGFARTSAGLLDAAFRRSGASPFGGLTDADQALLPVVTRLIRAQLDAAAESSIVLAPLGIGEHVDHLIARDAALALRNEGRRVVLYEDVPYCLLSDAPAGSARLPLQARRVEVDVTAGIEGWVRGVHCYSSQLRMLFGSREIEPLLRAHAVDRKLPLWDLGPEAAP